ncbi:MAG: hypothetical protein AB7S44_02730 [Spirochaetales bacterium]
MAKRKVFISRHNDINLFYEEDFEFHFYTGFAISQKQKSINELHDKIIEKYPNSKILEVSSKSNNGLGVELSAFNLQLKIENKFYFIENIFQSSKKFEKGGPYKDLLYSTPIEAKKDVRLKNSGKLKLFVYRDKEWELQPLTFFYDWIYINAVYQRKDLHRDICKYDIFTDIEFNDKKSINCQARSLAIFVGLLKNNMLEKVLSSPEEFKKIYNLNVFKQLNFFD